MRRILPLILPGVILMAWTDNYIEIPFLPDGRDRNGCDCYGLIHLIYKERLNIILPDYKGIFVDQSMKSLLAVAKTMQREKDTWTRVDFPDAYDTVMLRTGTYTWHIGLVVDSHRMIHIMHGINSMVEPFDGLLWKRRISDFRRYNG